MVIVGWKSGRADKDFFLCATFFLRGPEAPLSFEFFRRVKPFSVLASVRIPFFFGLTRRRKKKQNLLQVQLFRLPRKARLLHFGSVSCEKVSLILTSSSTHISLGLLQSHKLCAWQHGDMF